MTAALMTVLGPVSGCAVDLPMAGSALKSEAVQPAEPFPPVWVLDEPEPEAPSVPERPGTTYAVARAAYLVEELRYALRTSYPDSTIRDSRCEVCAFFLTLSETAARGRWVYRLGRISIVDVQPRPQLAGWWDLPQATPVVDLTLRIPASKLVDVDGEVVEELDAFVLRTRFQATTSPYKMWNIRGNGGRASAA